MFAEQQQKTQIYHVAFESYLQPKKPIKTRKLLLATPHVQNKSNLKLKLFESSEIISNNKNKWQNLFKKIVNKTNEGISGERLGKPLQANFLRKFSFKLPNFLSFLRARNDDGLCKRKSGFEIYCEMASIHGFYNFVGARTWQRAFWFSVVFLAILMSTIILIMSYLMNFETPFIISTDSTTHGAWSIPFPAITLCNQNRISKAKAAKAAEDLFANNNLSKQDIMKLFRLTLYTSDQMSFEQNELRLLEMLLSKSNTSLTKLFETISPDCSAELLRCKWKGQIEKCEKLFRVISTYTGRCCSFNLLLNNKTKPQRTISSSYKAGLTVLLAINADDYFASVSKSPGYRVLVHDSTEYPGFGSEQHYVRTHTESTISITPQRTYTTEYVRNESFKRRRCYLDGERHLETFPSYSFSNCLAECRNKMFLEACGCIPMPMPGAVQLPTCNVTQIPCILGNKEIFSKMLLGNGTRHAYRSNRYAEHFICNCYPPCSFNQYSSTLDTGVLDRTYSMESEELFKGVQLKDHILLHVFYGDLVAHQLRMDVYENWLSFIGTFGGITGLFMGCSFVSVFEMIFFVFVRPACNWLTKQQIRYRIKRRQQKAAKQMAKLERENQKRSSELQRKE